MIGPLVGEKGVLGALTIINRLGEGTHFEPDDLRLLETVANQAAVALENGQLEQSLHELSLLKEQLRHQAFHDSLTGLANRPAFVEEVELPADGRDRRLRLAGRRLPRPRRLQDRQRHARPCGRRPAAGRGRRTASASSSGRTTWSLALVATSSRSCPSRARPSPRR